MSTQTKVEVKNNGINAFTIANTTYGYNTLTDVNKAKLATLHDEIKPLATTALNISQISGKIDMAMTKIMYELQQTVDKKKHGISFSEFCERHMNVDKAKASKLAKVYAYFFNIENINYSEYGIPKNMDTEYSVYQLAYMSMIDCRGLLEELLKCGDITTKTPANDILKLIKKANSITTAYNPECTTVEELYRHLAESIELDKKAQEMAKNASTETTAPTAPTAPTATPNTSNSKQFASYNELLAYVETLKNASFKMVTLTIE